VCAESTVETGMPDVWKQWEVRLEELALAEHKRWSEFAAGACEEAPSPQACQAAHEMGEQSKELVSQCAHMLGKQHWATALATRCLADAMVFLRRAPGSDPAPGEEAKLRAYVDRWLKFLDRCISPHVPLQTFSEHWEKVLATLALS
jgi:hypothetical protein